MPSSQEVQESVTQLNVTVYGVHGQGGLVREVETISKRVEEHERKINAVSLKWLILMLLAGSMGNGLGTFLLQTLKSLN